MVVVLVSVVELLGTQLCRWTNRQQQVRHQQIQQAPILPVVEDFWSDCDLVKEYFVPV
jgi:hypothetical protein